MIVWILAAIDALAAIALLLAAVGYVVHPFQAIAALLLVIKGGMFYGDFLSIIDMLLGVLMIFLLWQDLPLVAFAAACYLGVKAAYSFS